MSREWRISNFRCKRNEAFSVFNAAASKKGARIDRQRVLTDQQLRDARERIEIGGRTTAGVAREMSVKHWTLSRSLRRQAETTH